MRKFSFVLVLSLYLSHLDAQEVSTIQQQVNAVMSGKSNALALTRIPRQSNRQTLTLAVEPGLWADYLEAQVIPGFSARTRVNVEVVRIDAEDLLNRQLGNIQAARGEYDLISLDSRWGSALASNGMLIPISSLHQQYAPNQPLQELTQGIASAALTMFEWNRDLFALPYQVTMQSNHYRSDLFVHPEEFAAFEAEYGYTLAPPKDIDTLLDVAQFFTRKQGQTLAGEVLQQDFYGVVLASGDTTHLMMDLNALLYGLGGNWLGADSELSLGESAQWQYVLETYTKLQALAPPGNNDRHQASDYFTAGQAAMYPFADNQLWRLNRQIEQNIDGTFASVDTLPLAAALSHGLGFAVPFDADNPRAAYWLMRYLSNLESQYALAISGGMPVRQEVLQDSYFSDNARRLDYLVFPQMLSDLQRATDLARFRAVAGNAASASVHTRLGELLQALNQQQQLTENATLKNIEMVLAQLQWLYGSAQLAPSFVQEADDE